MKTKNTTKAQEYLKAQRAKSQKPKAEKSVIVPETIVDKINAELEENQQRADVSKVAKYCYLFGKDHDFRRSIFEGKQESSFSSQFYGKISEKGEILKSLTGDKLKEIHLLAEECKQDLRHSNYTPNICQMLKKVMEIKLSNKRRKIDYTNI